MSELWLTDAAVAAMNGRLIGTPSEHFSGISIDSRSLQPGDAFFAITGENSDGHRFLSNAFAAGAALGIVEQRKLPGLGHISQPVIVVDNVLTALEKLGHAARQRMQGTVVAVTGSVGKTSTKEMLRLMLSKSGETHAAVASYNNHWGVPLTLARMAESANFGVFEIGMNHPGEITPLVNMVEPHVAIITTVEAVHLEFFESEDEIAKAKAEIFGGLVPGGVAIINRDNRHFDALSEIASQVGVETVLSFGLHEDADARLIECQPDSEGSTIQCDLMGEEIIYSLSTAGIHQACNSLAALLAVKSIGADIQLAADSLQGMTARTGRGERHHLQLPNGALTLIDESYNANPASMAAAINVLGETATESGGRRIAVLGDMWELGENSPQMHRGLASNLLAAHTDLVFCAGQLMKNLFDELPSGVQGGYAENADDLVSAVLTTMKTGDVVVVKGSLASKMATVVDALKSNFPSKKAVL
jgi:UDP-N-acetylmuramoyl-tripeptide--D-alanyl-D-alanine ligase